MSKRIMVAMGLWLAVAAGTAFAGKDGLPPGTTQADEIHQWIANLDSNVFAVRQAASRNLREAGGAVIEPLTSAANGIQSEVTRRAVDILEALCDADDFETADAARSALENLARSTHRLPAQRASLVLRGQRLRQQRTALAQIQRLGGSVTYAGIEEGELVIGSLVLGRKWEAGDEGLKYLPKLGRIEQLKLYGPQFTDEGLEQLAQLTGVQRLKLYATRISDDGQLRLQRALPGTEVDRRHGALLGVSGSGEKKGCLVTLVREGTAASRAGIERDDVITQVNGEPIPDMATLVATISKQRPGDRIKVTLLRGDDEIDKDIVLGELGEETE
jgi:hypothetical protein